MEVLEGRIRQIGTEADDSAARVRERHAAEVADLKQAFQKLQTEFEKANKDHLQDLQTAYEESSAKLSAVESRLRRAEEGIEEAEGRADRAESKLKDTISNAEKAEKALQEKETAREAAQTELDDLLMVLGDLEEKRTKDKQRLKDLGEQVSDADDNDDGPGSGDDDDEEEEDADLD